MSSKTLKIVEVVKDILSAYGYVAYVWHIDDVHFISEQNSLPKLTDEEAMEVFALADKQFDGEVGMSWPQLEKTLKTYMKSKVLLNALCDSE
jgi:hypothetical protein